MISSDLIRAVRANYALPWDGIHGINHWARVLENGLRLAEVTGASVPVIWHFAVFHDARRINEDWDPDHGRRGADFAARVRGQLVHLSDEDFDLLRTACIFHTDGLTEGHVTLQTCWDADRLDLGRVGIRPDSRYLCTPAAKRTEMIDWAYERSRQNHVPPIVSREWLATH